MITNDPLLASSVLILDTQKRVVGTGFTVSIFRDNTCALILTSTSAIERATSEKNIYTGQKVQIKFHIEDDAQSWEASISDWLPSAAENICAIEIEGTKKLPPKLRALSLNLTTNLVGRKVSIFGHTEAEPSPLHGHWKHSEFCLPGPRHHITDDIFLQVDLQDIPEGFKGAPVWDNAKRCVLGMITHIEYDNETSQKIRYVYAIPVEILYKISQSVLRTHKHTFSVHVEKAPLFHNDEAYTEGERHLFFGYEAVIERTMQLLDTHPKILAILGPEKSGKTSVVQAGLIPHIKNKGMENNENYGFLKADLSSREPLEDLQQQGLSGATQGMREAIHRWCQTYNYEGLYLILDQFEDFLRECPFNVQKTFVHQLLEVIEEHRATVIIILRDEFYSLLARHEKLVYLAEHALVNVFAPREKEQLVTIMEKYTEQAGIKQEPKELSLLIDQVLTNIEKEKGKQNSPLARINHYLTLEEYAQEPNLEAQIAVKAPSINLSEWADNLLSQFDESQQAFIKRLLTEVILLGDETLGIPDKKYYLPIEEISSSIDEYNIVEELIKQHFLVANRNKQNNLETITIAQDELIHEWPCLREWLDEKRQFIFWQKHIQQQMLEWAPSNRDPDKLLQNFQLVEAEKWLKIYPKAFNDDFHELLLKSRDKKQQLIRTRRNEFQRQIISQHETITQLHHRNFLSRYLVKQALELYNNPYLLQQGVQLAIIALALFPNLEADAALRKGITWLPRKIDCVKTRYPIQLASFSRTGRYAIANNERGQIGELKDKNWLHELYIDTKIKIMTFSPNGAYLAVAEDNGMIHIFFPEKEIRRETVVIVDSVTTLLFSPDSRYLAIIQQDKTILIKECTNWKTVYTKEYADQISAINFDTSGSTIVLGYSNGLVEMWKLGHKELLLQFTENYKSSIKAIALNLSTSYLAIAFKNNNVEIISIGRRELLFQYHHQGPIQFLVFSPDGHYSITGSDDSTIKIYDVLRRKELKLLEHQEAVYMGVFSQDGAYLATVSRDKMIKVWDVQQSFNLWMQFSQKETIQQIAFSPDKYYLFTANHNSTVCMWDIAQSNQSTTIAQKATIRIKSPVHTLLWTMNGDAYTLLVASEKKPPDLWLFREGYSLYTQPFSLKKATQKMLYSPKEKYLAAIGSDQTLYLWSSSETQPKRIHHASHIHSIAFSPDGRFLATGSQKVAVVSLWSVAEGKKWMDLPHPSLVNTLAFTPDSRMLITGCNNGEITLWNWRGEQKRYTCIPSHTSTVTAIAITPDGQHFATTSDNGEVYLWKADGMHLFSLPTKGYIHAIQFEQSGQYLITANEDGHAYIWSTIDGKLFQTLPQQKAVTCIAIHSDGKYIATGSKDGSVGIWEIATGQQIALLTHADEVVTLVFSPDDGKYLAAGCNDGTVKIWLWHPWDLICEAVSRIPTRLTEKEWQAYAPNEPYEIVSYLQFFSN